MSTKKELPEMRVYIGDGEWSALYVNSQLDTVGDHYLSDERIRSIAGVVEVFSEDFMRGQNTREGVAKTVDEVEEYRTAREDRERRAEELEQQARELERQAAELRKGEVKR